MPECQCPVLSTVWEDKLTLTYDEALDTGSVPNSGTFGTEVDGDGTSYSPVTVEIAGNAVTGTLDKPVPHDATSMTVIYVGHATNPIRDEAGNAAAALTDWPVTLCCVTDSGFRRTEASGSGMLSARWC